MQPESPKSSMVSLLGVWVFMEWPGRGYHIVGSPCTSTVIAVIFAVDPYLVTPYRPLAGALAKNDAVLEACVAHPERFLVSPISGDPRLLVAHALTHPDNAVWEVWRNDTFSGIILLDRIVPNLDARWQFVFFDDTLTDKVPVLHEFARRCFADLGFHRLTFEAPAHMAVLLSFARRRLGFMLEGGDSKGSRRERAYFDGERWHDVVTLRLLRAEVL